MYSITGVAYVLSEYSDLSTFQKIDKTVNAYATDDHLQKTFNHLVLKTKVFATVQTIMSE